MKKLLSLLLSLLMLALPVFSCGESATPSHTLADVFLQAPTLRYTAEGQAETTHIILTAGDGLAAFIPDEATLTAVKDLLDALTIQLKSQAGNGMLQGGLGLLLNGEDAVNLLVSGNSNGLYATSNLLGGQVYGISGEEFQKLFQQILQAAQINADASTQAVPTDPTAFINSMMTDVDTTAMQEAFSALLANVSIQQVTEAPDLLPEATQQVTFTIKKADLSKCLEETAKVFFSSPGLRQFLAMSAGVEEKELDTASMVAEITSVADYVKEDFDIRILSDATGLKQYVVCDIPLTSAEGKAAESENSLSVEYLNRNDDGVTTAQFLFSMRSGETAQLISLTAQTEDGSIAAEFALSTIENGEVSYPLTAQCNGVYSVAGELCTATFNTACVTQVAPEQFITISSVEEYENKDLGDHAMSSDHLTLSIEGLGELLSVSKISTTGPAEAYLEEGADVIHPMAMSEKELAELGESLPIKLQTGLFTILTKLPESVLTLMGGGTTN